MKLIPDGRTIPEYSIVLGLDYGEKFIGVALAHPKHKLLQPEGHISAKRGVPVWSQLESKLDQWKPDALVVGLPLHTNGKESRISKLVRKFAAQLIERYPCDCYLQDEHLTSHAARMETADLEMRHAIAARHILQSWLAQVDMANGGKPISELGFECFHQLKNMQGGA